jgi:drug/metabolite transporter (DMT)-like permease
MATGLSMGGVEWLLLLALSLLWSGSFSFTEIALTELPPFSVVLGRVALAAAALLLLVRLCGHRLPRTRTAWGAFLVMGALNNLIPFSLIV